jgi:pyruvate/2-oxoglutarate dehydrogenase complex dihydrolipoamide acyltransferase (E2) component
MRRRRVKPTTRKVRGLGERREQRRADRDRAAEAAVRVADELGIDLSRLGGTGSEGRITVEDVLAAQEA